MDGYAADGENLMPRPIQLEVFDLADGRGRDGFTDTELSDTRLAAFEKGYAEGWEDCLDAQRNTERDQKIAIAENLQGLSFTYQEARSHILQALEPLLHDMVRKVLPRIARETLGHIVVEHLRPVAGTLSDTQIIITCPPGAKSLIEALLPASGIGPVAIAEDAHLTPAQIFLNLAEREEKIDLDGVIAAMGQAVTSFFDLSQDPNHPMQEAVNE